MTVKCFECGSEYSEDTVNIDLTKVALGFKHINKESTDIFNECVKAISSQLNAADFGKFIKETR